MSRTPLKPWNMWGVCGCHLENIRCGGGRIQPVHIKNNTFNFSARTRPKHKNKLPHNPLVVPQRGSKRPHVLGHAGETTLLLTDSKKERQFLRTPLMYSQIAGCRALSTQSPYFLLLSKSSLGYTHLERVGMRIVH